MTSTKRKGSDVPYLDADERKGTKRREFVKDNIANPVHKLSYPSTSATARAVPFQQPSPLLTFSYTPAHELEFTDSALRYYVPPPNGADLRYGYERWVKRREEKGRLDGLLKAILKLRERMERSDVGSGSRWCESVGVVAWRGVMTKIFTAPYEERDGWEMNVMDMDGTLYLEEHLTDAKLKDKEDMTPHHRVQSYYGYSFEAWSTSSRPSVPEHLDGHPPGWGGDVDTNVQWCCVVKTKLGDTRLVIGGEVDCVRDSFDGNTNKLIELKTSMVIRGTQDEARFEKKLLKFYFQSFLLGVPEIVVGFRTPAGQLSTLQSFNTMQIPRLVRGKRSAWDPMVCFDWGQRLITFLKSTIRVAGEDTAAAEAETVDGAREPLAKVRYSDHRSDKPLVWRVVFQPKEGISVTPLDGIGVQEVEAGEDRVGFLPRWYFDEIRTRSRSGSVTRPTQSCRDRQDAGGTRSPGHATKEANPVNPTHMSESALAGWIT